MPTRSARNRDRPGSSPMGGGTGAEHPPGCAAHQGPHHPRHEQRKRGLVGSKLSQFRTLVALAALTIASTVSPLSAQDASPVIAPADNLVIDGVPSLPATLSGDVRRYTESRSAFLSDWHPPRREALIATRFGNTVQLHGVKMPGGDRTQLTFFEEPVAGGIYEPRTGK